MTLVAPSPKPESRRNRRLRAGDAAIVIEFVDGLEDDRLLRELAHALGRQAAQKLFSQQDATQPAMAGAEADHDG